MGMAAAAVGAGALGAAGNIYSSSQNASAAKHAANAQQQANAQAMAEQQREYGINQQHMAPFLQSGQGALSQQMQLLGLGGIPGIGPNGQAQTPDYAAYVQNNPDLLAAYQAQAGGSGWAPNGAAGMSMEQFGQNHFQQYGAGDRSFTPYGQGGDAATQQQNAINGLQNQPLYQSLMRNGQQAILANGAATGGLRGGNMQNSLAHFGSDTLSAVIQQQLQSLGGLAANGQNAGNSMGAAGQNTANQISSLLSQNGQVQANGSLLSAGLTNGGISSALSQGMNGIGNYLMMPQNANPNGWGAGFGNNLAAFDPVSSGISGGLASGNVAGLTPTPGGF
jgi:hypothetical protein